MEGVTKALNVLGEKISELESSLKYERYMKEENERGLRNLISELEKENKNLREKLNSVHKYIDQMEG